MLHIHPDIVCVLLCLYLTFSPFSFSLLFGKDFLHSDNRKCTILYQSCSVNQLLSPSKMKVEFILLIFFLDVCYTR